MRRRKIKRENESAVREDSTFFCICTFQGLQIVNRFITLVISKYLLADQYQTTKKKIIHFIWISKGLSV